MWKNFFGLQTSQKEIHDIPNPRLELYTHVTFKTVQLGAFMGFAMIGPIVNYCKGELSNIFERNGYIYYASRSSDECWLQRTDVELWSQWYAYWNSCWTISGICPNKKEIN